MLLVSGLGKFCIGKDCPVYLSSLFSVGLSCPPVSGTTKKYSQTLPEVPLSCHFYLVSSASHLLDSSTLILPIFKHSSLASVYLDSYCRIFLSEPNSYLINSCKYKLHFLIHTTVFACLCPPPF